MACSMQYRSSLLEYDIVSQEQQSGKAMRSLFPLEASMQLLDW